MTLTFKHSAVMLAALVGAALTTAVLAEKGPMGGMMPDFEVLDADKDGKVTKEELAANHAARFAEADTDKDGKLSADEIVAMRKKAEDARMAKMADKMIGRLDSDKDGYVSAAEMEAMPMRDKMFARMDENADGAISSEEMDAMKTRMGDHMQGGDMGHGKHGGGWWNCMGNDN